MPPIFRRKPTAASLLLGALVAGVRHLACLALLLLFPWSGLHAATTQYYYDDLGRIVQAIRSDGSVRQYQYDENGNILAINRISASTLSVSGFAPRIGHVGATVSIFGTGFSPTPSENEVRFGPAAAAVSSATNTQLVVVVPQGASTGPITVISNGASVTSAESYVVRKPAIMSFSPAAVSPGGQVTVVGSNLNLVPGGTTVSVGSTAVPLTSLTNAQALFNAPTTGGSAPIQIATPYGNASSASMLIVAPPAIGASNIVSISALPSDGTTQAINISEANKFGVFTFAATQDQYLSVQISSFSTTPSNSTIAYSIYTPANTLLTSGHVSVWQKTIHLPRIPATGTYLLAFGSGSGSSSVQLSARLEVNAVLAASGLPLPSATESAAQGKRLIYQGTLGEQLGLAIKNVVMSPSGGYISYNVYRPDGGLLVQFACYASSVPGCQHRLSLPSTGSYLIVATPGSTATMSFTLTLSHPISGLLALDTPQNLDLAIPGQHASLKFTATEGQTVAIGVPSITTAPANKAIWLTVFGPTGAQVGSSGSSTAPIVDLRNLAAGTYTVLVHTIDAATAAMQVTLASGMAGEVPVDNGSASFTSTLKRQQGYFTFAGTAGESLGLAITNILVTPNTGSLSFTLYRPNGSHHNTFTCGARASPGCQFELRNLPTTGTYTIVAAPNNAATMSFALRLTRHITASLTPDAPRAVDISTPGQYVLFSFAATAGQTVAIGASSITTAPANSAIWLIVFGPTGAQVGSSGSSTAPIVDLRNLAAGTYTVLVYTIDAATAAMELTLASGMAGEVPIDNGSASFTSTLKRQQGYFTFAGTAGESLGLAITNILVTPNTGSLSFTLYRPNGSHHNTFTCGARASPGCQFELRNLPTTGTYTIVAAPNNAATMSFALRLTRHVTIPLTLGAPQTADISLPGQYMVLRFTATAGQTVAIGASSIMTTPANRAVWLTAFGPNGAQIASSGSSTGPLLNLTNLAAGTHTVLVHTIDAATAAMQVTLASGMVGEIPIDNGSASFTSTLKGQNGYFTFAGTAGDSLGLAVTNIIVTPNTGSLSLTLYRPNGSYHNAFSCGAQASPGCQFELRNLPVTGTYTIVATPSTAATMSFALRLSRHLTGALSVGTPSSLNLAVPGQYAALTFNATASMNAVVSASALSTTPANRAAWLSVLNPSGSQIASSGSSTGPTVNLTNLAAGTYTVLVNTIDAATATMQLTLQ